MEDKILTKKEALLISMQFALESTKQINDANNKLLQEKNVKEFYNIIYDLIDYLKQYKYVYERWINPMKTNPETLKRWAKDITNHLSHNPDVNIY